MLGSCWQLIVPIGCSELLMWAQGCPALFWTQYWKFMTDPAREPFKHKSLWEPVHPMSRDLNNRKIRKDIFISPVSSQPSPVGFPQPFPHHFLCGLSLGILGFCRWEVPAHKLHGRPYLYLQNPTGKRHEDSVRCWLELCFPKLLPASSLLSQSIDGADFIQIW